MFDQLSAEILASLIKGFPRTTTTTKQNIDQVVHFVYSRVKTVLAKKPEYLLGTPYSPLLGHMPKRKVLAKVIAHCKVQTYPKEIFHLSRRVAHFCGRFILYSLAFIFYALLLNSDRAPRRRSRNPFYGKIYGKYPYKA
jgi:hypothetical protein